MLTVGALGAQVSQGAAPSAAASAPGAGLSTAASGVQNLFGAAVPAVPSDRDTAAVTLGVAFTSSVGGKVTGVRFYKGAANTGTHTGYLFGPKGGRLAKVTFRNETASGWQRATFSTPVAITAGRSYVAAYHAPKGRYAAQVGGFSSPRVRGALTATAGVFRYGTPGYPTQTWKATNYYVDVQFVPDAAPAPSPTASPSPTATPSPSPTASPKPTATPVPTSTAPGADCRAGVWQNLEACGWPGPGNTGPAEGTAVAKSVSGGYTVTTDGAVLAGWQVSGGILVRARNVVIRDSWVSNSVDGASGSGVIKIAPGASATIERTLLDGRNATHACIFHEGSSMTAIANECRGANDGIFSWTTVAGQDGNGDNFLIADNYLHSFSTQSGNGHVDGYQTEGAKHGVIRHNTFDVAQGQTSAIAIWNGRKSSSDISVERNLIAGGGFSVYAQDYHPSESSPAGGYSVTDITFTGNVFSTNRFGCVGNWGVWFPRGAPTDGWQRSGNTVLESGQAVDAGNPTANGVPCT